MSLAPSSRDAPRRKSELSMNREISRRQWLLFALGCAAMASIVFALRTKASSADEIPRLAALMDWKPGVVVADIGAGDGSYAFAAVEHVDETGKIIATEIDAEKLKSLRAEVKKRDLAKRNSCGKRRSGNEFACFLLRRDLFAARLPSFDEAHRVRRELATIFEAWRKACDHRFSPSSRVRQSEGRSERPRRPWNPAENPDR